MRLALINAPATSQRMLDILLSGCNWPTYLIYLDDVIVFSKSFDAHLNNLDMVLPRLRKTGASFNLKKHYFFIGKEK